MMGLDRLFELVSYLDRISNTDPVIVTELQDYLTVIFDSDDYQKWLAEDQFLGGRSQRGKPREPLRAAAKAPELKHLPYQYALVANGRLQLKIDKHFDRIHVTDGFWVDPSKRVYPTCDESQILCNFINGHVRLVSDGFLIDPACGCGHHSLGLHARFRKRVSLDINGRSLAFCRFNSILQGDVRHLVGFGDVRDGIPLEIASHEGDHVVFAVNMPFSIPPHAETFSSVGTSLAQTGGDRGIELTLAALDAISDFSRRSVFEALDAAVLCYTLGYQEDDGSWRWEIDEIARELFEGSAASVSFHLLKDEKLWRVNGKKEQPNPMPLESLVKRADCRITYHDSVRDSKREGYLEKIRSLKAEGFTHLGYGILHVRFPQMRAAARILICG
jgi:hypothetical protein